MKNYAGISDKLENLYKHFELSDEKTRWVNEFLDLKTKYVFGQTEFSQKLFEQIDIDYIIDDFSSERFNSEKIEIIKTKDVDKNAVVVCSINGANVQKGIEVLKQNGIEKIISISDLAYLHPEKFSFPVFVENTRKYFEKNKAKFNKIYEMLADEKSKQTFEDVYSFRLTGQYEFLKNYKVEIIEQYFAYAEFLKFSDCEVFVDCGGYIGDTSSAFIKKNPKFKKIYFFEPCNENMNKAKMLLKNNNIEFVEKAVSDKEEILFFEDKVGSTCNINKNGNIKIETVTLDDIVKEAPTFVKADLEGWEIPALIGAEKLIAKYQPKLAISVYHKPDDIYEIPMLIENIVRKNNIKMPKIYLRHYTQGYTETVMFFIWDN